ncbi:ATPase with role in protein import into the ER [Curvularia kusanoi]|uniref:non-chaperonin molecular chaperone ATPase n=1 Tax=Curvularia kusanoi TaxID=90978 RepID=A0A9P4TBL2_CURKU|nr:ATPase with role in protein import into the ER [Curvularia kusanoi]
MGRYLHEIRIRPTRTSLCCSFWFLIGVILLRVANAENKRLPVDNSGLVYGPIIGVDFGTSYSRVSIVRDGDVQILADEYGSRVTPSWVAFTDEGHLVGTVAKAQAPTNARRTIYGIKRFIGQSFDSVSIDERIKSVPFKLVNTNGQPQISTKLEGKEARFSPEELLSMILRRLKGIAEIQLGETVRGAVVATPAHFDDAQRAAIKNAGEIAGLEILRIVNEPSAAALAYGLGSSNQTEITTFGLPGPGQSRNVLIYDLGADTLDVSVLAIEEGVFEIQSTVNNAQLGGERFNERVFDYMTKSYSENYNIDIAHEPETLAELKQQIEMAKRTLSLKQAATLRLKLDSHKIQHEFEDLTRSQFETLNEDLFQETFQCVKRALQSANLTESDIDDVILAGGSSHIPRIQQMHENMFGDRVRKHINPEEVVAMGAALQGNFVANDHGGCYFGDVTSSSLGIEVIDGIMDPVILRGTFIPTRKSRTVSTKSDNQTTFSIRIFEGERFRTTGNHKLGEFELVNIAPAPRGIPQIEITFELDHNDILRVSAIEKGSGQRDSIDILKSSRVAQWDHIYEEWKEHDEEDRIDHAWYASRRRLEDRIHGLKRQINTHDGFDSRIKTIFNKQLADAVQEAEDWLDATGWTAARNELEEYSRKHSETLDLDTDTTTHQNWWHWCQWWPGKSCTQGISQRLYMA